MAANTTPRYTLNGDPATDALAGSPPVMAPTFTTAAADYDGTTATHNKQVWKAGANGGRIAGLRFKAKGTNTASLARIFINNGSSPTSAANNAFFGECGLPGSSASNTSPGQDVDYFFPNGYVDLPAGFCIVVGLATTVAAGWVCTPIQGGQF